MPTYLVERYLPGRDRTWLEAALARLPNPDGGVEYLGSIYVPADDSCFSRFEAADADRVRLVNELAQVPFARITASAELAGTQKRSQPRRRISMNRLIGLILTVAAFAMLAAAGQAQPGSASSPRAGALHVTKECSAYNGQAGAYCTIVSSNINAINDGARIVYADARIGPLIDTDVVLDTGEGNNAAFGHVTLNLATRSGLVTFSGGTGRFSGFEASAIVSFDPVARVWQWDGVYSFTPPGLDS